ncbi:hypothetical protein ACX27_21525 [Nostoc piscinale CENA21]|uniref:Plastid lipid-associated protein/fibrillin conserved domain-containing protein n=1 Tax=Nostoc piscinale CENA21 TaxID=224013 RepID=A0A0M3V653_9NOSO|nr:hypothetical protein [Nostoc piscinale]ALF54827.1 hypothetical protein ACX27_21525 [Nostoc piscinale CENA21]
MTAELPSIAASEFVATLAQAGQNSDRPSAKVVVDALLQAEKTAKQQRISYNFDSLVGTWRLCFATGTRKVRQRGGIILGRGFYWPKFTPTDISFSKTTPITGEISNQVKLGSALLKLTGPVKYLGKKNLLAFDFTHIQISLFGRIVYNKPLGKNKSQKTDFDNQPIAKLPFFAFFLVTDNFIAARGRGGGLALWVKEK